jgi:hypothetical protein
LNDRGVPEICIGVSMAFLRYSDATVDPNRLSLWPDVLAP